MRDAQRRDRIGNTIGAAFTNRRVLEPVEARTAIIVGLMLLGLAILFAFFPRALAYPLVVASIWVAMALLKRGLTLYSQRKLRDRNGSGDGTLMG